MKEKRRNTLQCLFLFTADFILCPLKNHWEQVFILFWTFKTHNRHVNCWVPAVVWLLPEGKLLSELRDQPWRWQDFNVLLMDTSADQIQTLSLGYPVPLQSL